MQVTKVAKDKSKPVGQRELKHVVLDQARPEEMLAVSAFNPGFLDAAIAEGWVETSNPRDPQVGDEIEFKTLPPATYLVTAARGRYCCHCEAKLPDDDFSGAPGALAREHVASEHPGEESPDPDNPAGYRCDNFVVMEKVS